MLIKFIQKKVVEGIAKESISRLPELKEMALLYLKEHKDEILEAVKEKIIELIKSKVGR